MISYFIPKSVCSRSTDRRTTTDTTTKKTSKPIVKQQPNLVKRARPELSSSAGTREPEQVYLFFSWFCLGARIGWCCTRGNGANAAAVRTYQKMLSITWQRGARAHAHRRNPIQWSLSAPSSRPLFVCVCVYAQSKSARTNIRNQKKKTHTQDGRQYNL